MRDTSLRHEGRARQAEGKRASRRRWARIEARESEAALTGPHAGWDKAPDAIRVDFVVSATQAVFVAQKERAYGQRKSRFVCGRGAPVGDGCRCRPGAGLQQLVGRCLRHQRRRRGRGRGTRRSGDRREPREPRERIELPMQGHGHAGRPDGEGRERDVRVPGHPLRGAADRAAPLHASAARRVLVDAPRRDRVRPELPAGDVGPWQRRHRKRRLSLAQCLHAQGAGLQAAAGHGVHLRGRVRLGLELPLRRAGPLREGTRRPRHHELPPGGARVSRAAGAGQRADRGAVGIRRDPRPAARAEVGARQHRHLPRRPRECDRVRRVGRGDEHLHSRRVAGEPGSRQPLHHRERSMRRRSGGDHDPGASVRGRGRAQRIVLRRRSGDRRGRDRRGRRSRGRCAGSRSLRGGGRRRARVSSRGRSDEARDVDSASGRALGERQRPREPARPSVLPDRRPGHGLRAARYHDRTSSMPAPSTRTRPSSPAATRTSGASSSPSRATRPTAARARPP